MSQINAFYFSISNRIFAISSHFSCIEVNIYSLILWTFHNLPRIFSKKWGSLPKFCKNVLIGKR